MTFNAIHAWLRAYILISIETNKWIFNDVVVVHCHWSRIHSIIWYHDILYTFYEGQSEMWYSNQNGLDRSTIHYHYMNINTSDKRHRCIWSSVWYWCMPCACSISDWLSIVITLMASYIPSLFGKLIIDVQLFMVESIKKSWSSYSGLYWFGNVWGNKTGDNLLFIISND